jgi:hypothetical protein
MAGQAEGIGIELATPPDTLAPLLLNRLFADQGQLPSKLMSLP